MKPSNKIKNFSENIGSYYSMYEPTLYNDKFYMSLKDQNNYPIEGYSSPSGGEFFWADASEFFIQPSKPINMNFKAQNSTFDLDPNFGAVHIKSNKINKTIMILNLNFLGVTDIICSGIIGFFEYLGGEKSFLFKLETPFNEKKRFICKTWNHSYKYFNCHDISCSFIEIK